MRRALWVVTLLACAAAARGVTPLREVTVTAPRPLSRAGLQTTAIDSTALRESVARSLADLLAFNSSVFVKSHGRASLSTISFRGTSPSHTRVTWNGLGLDNPMLGMTDFSTVPAFLIDKATLLHGSSSVSETSGGIGGSVSLATAPAAGRGWGVQYVQGAGSFKTFDEFLRVSYGGRRWHTTTRAVCSTSPNDFKFTNRDKKVNVYDDQHNIISSLYPRERNRSGAYRDVHLLQDVGFDSGKGDVATLSLWGMWSDRELPMLTTDYGDESSFENRQIERTLRGVLSWNRSGRGRWKTDLRAGFALSRMNYVYRREVSPGNMATMTSSRSHTGTYMFHAAGEYWPADNWYLTAGITANVHHVESTDRNVATIGGGSARVGYDRTRPELSASVSAKWRPVEPLALSAVVRQELVGRKWSPVVPALFADLLVSRRGNVTVKGSVSGNYRSPSLNDLYFLPGGNPGLRPERGLSYDAGVSFLAGRPGSFSIGGGATWFGNRIRDRIMWLPTVKGYFTPRNLNRVHSHGVELKGSLALELPRGWRVNLDGSFAWTRSINRGPALSEADRSVGRQLPYVPVRAASATARVSYGSWALLYKWNHYSERFTMTSNDASLSGRLPAYYMNCLTLEKAFRFPVLDLELKLSVDNLFNEEYLSELARPMPGINFEFFITLTPKFHKF